MTRPITLDDFNHLVRAMGQVAQDDIDWAESRTPPADADRFAQEAIFVIANSGMQHKVAQGIFDRCMEALRAQKPVSQVFKHVGKAAAMEAIWRDRERLLQEFLASEDKFAFLRALPWIGPITVFHLAKNFAVADCAKPDVHLQRLADREGVTAQALCERLAEATGYRVATIDTLLWRASANGFLDSKTGAIDLSAGKGL